MVELALNRILLAALVKSKYLVRQIQPIRNEAEPLVEAVASLDVYLRMRIEVLVAVRSLQPEHRIPGINTAGLRPKVRGYVLVVVAYCEPQRQLLLVVCQAQVVVVRCLPLQAGVISTSTVETRWER